MKEVMDSFFFFFLAELYIGLRIGCDVGERGIRDYTFPMASL
jgi:hypothetical protein